tara:strand:- start:2351 stop:3580 length:1230 start_codon:yes stop_codon:yes gene_type:complete
MMVLNSLDALVDSNPSFNLQEKGEYSFLLKLVRRIQCGTLVICMPDGGEESFSGPNPGPKAMIKILNPRIVRRILFWGSIGFAEGYINNDWSSDDLAKLLELISLNIRAWKSAGNGSRFNFSLNKLIHYFRPNSIHGSRRNIAAHYDLGNEFYRLWLDDSMSYSSGLFEGKEISLEDAQRCKSDRLLNLLEISPEDNLLEIGSGWGRFAIYAAKQTNCKVKAVTISSAQYNESLIFHKNNNESSKVEFLLQDYRDIVGQFDRIVSVEMIEAVGERYWELYFKRLRSLLRPGGKVVLQAITIDESAYSNYRSSVDFIQKYIFPGGMLPTRSLLMQLASNNGFKWVHDKSHADDYAKTLLAWRERFENALPEIKKMGFDDRFCRTWKYYLSYCEAGFRTKRTNVHQILLSG